MTIVFKANKKGIAELLRLPDVLSDLEQRAERVASAASDGVAQYGVRSETGPVRARAAIVTENFDAMLAEHREHRLARVIDAAGAQ